MKKTFYTPTLIATLSALTVLPLTAQTTAPDTPTLQAKTTVPQQEKTAILKELEKLNQEKELREAKLELELAEMNAQIAKLKAEREIISEKQQIADLKKEAEDKLKQQEAEDLKVTLAREAAIAKSKASLASSQLSLEMTNITKASELREAEIEALKADTKRQNFADAKPIYLDNPLKDDGTLVISDRRITFNGPVLNETANYITERIHFYNNKDKTKPIFIVIGDSPGGSVMAGYRILKAMEGSDAPVHVVVKSFAASMAATIATLAEESYAYPNAIILHHQISSSFFFTTMNLTQQKESYEESQKWWIRLAQPIADKMGITTDQLIKQMYEKNSDGNWVEFATEAKKLKWINHIVERVKETSQVINPDSVSKKSGNKESTINSKESLDKQGRPCMYLPRINPHDVYFLYNPDGYYQLRK